MAGSFYEAYVEVIPTAKGFEKSLTKQMAGPSASAGGAAGGAAGGGFVAGFGKAIPILGAVIAAAGIGDLIGDAINNASNYAQAQGAVEDVFGRLGADAIEAFADGGAKTVGQSMSGILSSAKDFGIFGKAAGLADDDLVDFSKNLITLGADLSAFANTSPEEAVQALAAGLRGESEPLRKYGVLLDDATLRAKALELGIYDGNGSLTQQQRILAANAVIFDKTAIQQGKFADESDTLAGKQAILAASFENISTKIGTAFLPIADQMVDLIVSDMIPALEDFAVWLQKPETKEGIKNFGTALGEVANFCRDMGAAFVDTSGLIAGVVGFINGSLNFEAFKQKLLELPGFWGMVFRAADEAGRNIGRSIGIMIANVQNFARETGANINNAVGFFRQLPGQITNAVGNFGSLLFGVGRDLINGLVRGIQNAAGAVRAAIGGVVEGAIDWAKSLLGIASPSKVFAEIGEFTGKGYAQGIESQYATVRASTAGMAGAAVSGAESVSGAGFTNNGTIQVTDERALVDYVETKKRRAYAAAGVFA